MFSPERYGARRSSFGAPDEGNRPVLALKTAFRSSSTSDKRSHSGNRSAASDHHRSALQQAAHLRFSEPATPSVLKDRGLRPSDLGDPHKKEFLTNLTTRVFHLALVCLIN